MELSKLTLGFLISLSIILTGMGTASALLAMMCALIGGLAGIYFILRIATVVNRKQYEV